MPIRMAEIKEWPHQTWQGVEEWKRFWNTTGTNVKQLHCGKQFSNFLESEEYDHMTCHMTQLSHY